MLFRPGNTLPVFPTRFGPIGVQICYDFWFNPELSRILALKGARLILNCCGTFAGEGKRDYMVQTTSVRAQENLVYTASANLVGGPEHNDYSAESLDRRPPRRLPRPQRDRRARVPALQPGVRGGRRRRGDRERNPQLREAAPLAVGVPDARLARGPWLGRRRVFIAEEITKLANP